MKDKKETLEEAGREWNQRESEEEVVLEGNTNAWKWGRGEEKEKCWNEVKEMRQKMTGGWNKWEKMSGGGEAEGNRRVERENEGSDDTKEWDKRSDDRNDGAEGKKGGLTR